VPEVALREVCAQDRHPVEPGGDEAAALPYLGLEHIEPHTGRILPAAPGQGPGPGPRKDGEIGRSVTFRFDGRHVLYGKLRPYLNKVALPQAAGRCSTEIVPLLPGEALDRAYLALYLRSPRIVERASAMVAGSRMPRIDVALLLREPIPLPPVKEQRRIAARLLAALAHVEDARRAAAERLAAIAALPEALLYEAFGPFDAA
jgi:type I restriction enzyme S subunit